MITIRSIIIKIIIISNNFQNNFLLNLIKFFIQFLLNRFIIDSFNIYIATWDNVGVRDP